MNIKNDSTVLYSVLAYFPLLWLIGLILGKNDSDVRFHVNQGIILNLFDIAMGIVVSLLGILPIIRHLTWIFWLAPLALIIIGVLNAITKRRNELPVIGNLITFIR